MSSDKSAYHGHYLAYRSIGDAQLVNDGRQDKGDAPTANTMGDPYHKEGYECRIFEQRFRLLPAERLRLHRWCLFGEVINDSLPFLLIQERNRLRIIREVEERYDRTKDRRHSFQDEELSPY